MTALESFHFLRPWWLAALLPLGLLLWWLWRRPPQTRVWERLCDAHLLPHLLVRRGALTRMPIALLALGWLLAVIALAGPAWSQLPQPVFRGDAARVLVLDLSASMNAADLRPSRVARARFKLLDLLGRLQEGQTALVVYAGDAHVVSPLTDDADTISALVPALAPELMPAQGSDAASALRLAGDLLTRTGAKGGEILLVTDGIPRLAEALEAVSALHRAGRRVSVLAVGTAEGAPIPEAGGGFLKDASGAIVVARLDPKPLRTLARAGGGMSLTMRIDDRDLDAWLDSMPLPEPALGDGDTARTADRWREDGPWLVLVLLPLAALAFRRGWMATIFIAVLIAPHEAQAWEWTDLWLRPDQRGAAALAEGRAAEAAEAFKDPRWQGTAHYRAEAYEQAAEAFSSSDLSDDHYNRGNALARAGRLAEALDAYREVLARDPDHADAEHNRELIEALLKDQQQPQSSPQSGGEQTDSQTAPGDEGASGGERQPEESQHREGQAGPSSEDAGRQADATGEREPGQQNNTAEASPADDPQAGQQRQDPSVPAVESDDPLEQPAGNDAGQDAPAHKTTDSDDTEQPQTESHQALEQWLRRIPDDPGGLLRRKFLLEHQRRQARRSQEGPLW